MKINKMTMSQFKDMHPQDIGSLIIQYRKEIDVIDNNPIDLERHYTKKELQQIASLLGALARTIIAINRKGEI